MILKVLVATQLILIQIISAHILTHDSKCTQNYLANRPLAVSSRCRRQINNPPAGLPGNGNLPANGPAGLPFSNGIPFGNFPRGNGLPNNFVFNNGLPNNLALNNGLPNNLAFGNGLPNNLAFNNILPNNMAFNYGLPNNTPLNLPVSNLNNVQNNRVLSNMNSINNNGLPFNNVPNGLPNINNLPVMNGLQNLNNGAAGNNLINLNNFPGVNTLPNKINIPDRNGLPNFNNFPSGSALPPMLPINEMSLNNLPSGNLLPPNTLPFNNLQRNFNNFQITGFGFANGFGNNKNYPQNNLPIGNLLTSSNNLQISNEFPNLNTFQNGLPNNNMQLPNRLPSIIGNLPNDNGLTNINNLPMDNGFPVLNNIAYANGLPNNINKRFTSMINFPIENGISNVNNLPAAGQNINNMLLNNNFPGATNNFQTGNMMPINEQQFVDNNPFNNDFIANNFPVDTGMANVNSLPVNAISNGLPPSNSMNNGGYINEGFFNANGMPVNIQEVGGRSGIANGFSSNNLQFGNLQMPVNNLQFDFADENISANQNLLPNGLPMSTNVLGDCQSGLASNNFNLAQELLNNLQIEGFANLPMINGLPVAGITETVTVLNNPCS